MNRFVILSTQRSGSNWLEDRLGAHPRVTMYREEVFRTTLHTEVAYRSYRRASPLRRALGAVAPGVNKLRYLRWLVRQAPVEAPCIGFRLMYDQLRRNPSVGAQLVATRTPTVHLVRENVLATEVSVAAARESGLYVTRSASKKSPAVRLEPGTLVATLDRRVALIERHRRLLRFTPSIEVRFEDMAESTGATDCEIQRFLGLSEADLGSALKRSGDRVLADRILNVDDVRVALAGTSYAAMVDRS